MDFHWVNGAWSVSLLWTTPPTKGSPNMSGAIKDKFDYRQLTRERGRTLSIHCMGR
jgi:hypothetical protein